MGKGSSSSGQGAPQQSSIATYDTTVPTYAQPYVSNMLGATQGVLYNPAGGLNQYQPYSTNASDYFAQFSPLQQQAQQSAANMQVAPQLGQATDITNQAAQGAFNTAGQAGQYGAMGAQAGQTGQDIGVTQGGLYGAQGFGYGQQAAGLSGANIGAGALGMQQGLSYGQNATNPAAVQAYMNPYLQATLAPAQQLLNQQYGMQGAQEQGAATSAGAFGGSREALMAGLNQQNRMLAQNQLVSNAYNQAYNTANQNMQQAATLGMQGAGLGLQGLAGANTAYNTGLAGVNAGLAGVNAQLAGTAQGMQGAQTGLAGVNAAQAGYNLAGQEGQNLMNIGNAGYNQQMGITNLQNQIGSQETAAQQAIINQAVQNYTNAQQYPYMQLGFASNMLRGLPMSAQTVSNYVGVPNPYTQAVSGIGTIANAPGLFADQAGTASGSAKGGLLETKKMASGGIAQAYDVGGAVRADLYQMSPQELKQYMQESSSPEAKRMAQEILNEKMPQQMASGGIAGVKRYVEGETVNSGIEDIVPADVARATREAGEQKSAGILNAIGQAFNQYQDAYVRTLQNPEVQAARAEAAKVAADDVAAQQAAFAPQQPPTPVANPPAVTAAAPQATPATMGPGGIPINVGTSQPTVPSTAAAPATTQTAPATTQTAPRIAPAVPTGGIASAGGIGDEARRQYEQLTGEKIKTAEELRKEREDYLGPNTAAQNERARIMAERANQADEKERLMQIRRAQFFADLGTKTGPTIMAAAAAMKETLPNLVEDQKEQRKQRQELDKAMYQLEMSERAEKAGNYDAAQASKDKAVGHLVNVNKSMVDIRKQELENQGKMAVAGLQERRADKRFDIEQQKIDERRKADEAKAAAQEKKLYIDKYAAAERERITAANNWAKIKNSDDYKFTEQTANMPNPNKDPKKQSVIDRAKQKLEDYHREYKAPVDALETSRRWYGTQAGILKEGKNPEGVVDLNQFLNK